MNPKKDHQLIQRVLDGLIGPKGFKAFQERLRREPELVALYRQYALLHHVLCEEFEGQRLIRKPVPMARHRLPVVLAWLAAAAVIAWLAVVQWRSPASRAAEKRCFATASFSEDAVWEIAAERQAADLTMKLDQGAIISLHQGQARITLNSGAVAVIDGDTELGLVSADMLRLNHGRGRFRLATPGIKLTVTTSSLSVVDLGTEFGVMSDSGRPDEVHVSEGRVELILSDGGQRHGLAAGEAARVMNDHTIERMPATMARFPQELPRFVQVLEDRFDEAAASPANLDQHHPRQAQGTWRMTTGKPPVIAGSQLEGTDFKAFLKLTEKAPAKDRPILLATMAAVEPLHGKFHTAGYAGMSLFQNGRELLFFGDAYGPQQTWAMDLQRGLPIVFPKTPLIGPRTVTLCYNRNTGAATLHEGSRPLGPAFCSTMLPPGLEFDEIRIAAVAGGTLALRALDVRSGGASEDHN